MVNTLYAVIAAAIAAACLVGFPSLSPQVEASAPVAGSKSDRADMRPLGTECSEKAWPYFEATCLRVTQNPLMAAREVRVIVVDRAHARR
jgi:hypothetical protein